MNLHRYRRSKALQTSPDSAKVKIHDSTVGKINVEFFKGVQPATFDHKSKGAIKKNETLLVTVLLMHRLPT